VPVTLGTRTPTIAPSLVPALLARFVEHKYRVFLVCAIGIFVTVFDTSSSIVALPTIALEFGTSLPTAQWVVIGNSLIIAALLVPMGRLSDIIGRKRIYVFGCYMFATGALLAWFSSSIFGLIVARGIVGIGSAMTQGTAMAILVRNFDISERAKMLGFQMGGVGLGAMTGPALGGIIVGTLGWRTLFAVSAITMALVGIAGQKILRRRSKRPAVTTAPFDIAGAVLFSSLLISGLLTLTLGPRFGWAERGTVAGATLFAALLLAFIAVERRHSAPMLDLSLFRNPAFAFGALAALIVFMCMSATRFLAPFFFQGVKGFDPSRVGLLMLPAATITAFSAPLAGRFADRFGVRFVANIGFTIAMLGLVTFVFLQTATPIWVVVAGLMVMALGMSSFGAPNSAAILNSVDAGAYGVASGFVNLCRNTGNVIGIAFGTAIVTLTMASSGYEPSLSEVNAASDSGIYVAFTDGVRSASTSLLAIAMPILLIVIMWSWRVYRSEFSHHGH
jgi:EmrB/QacA subfamily drug resistance transporter